MRSYRSTLSSVIVAGLCSGAMLVGQTVTTGAISGKVTDSGHAPVAGAVIRATSGQVTRTVTTNAEGSFTLSLLNGGAWTLQVSKPGFATANKSVQVMVNSMTPTTFRIAKESAAVVEVVAAASTIDTSSTTTGSTFSVDTLSQMPVGGDLSSIAMLTPGVTTSGFTSTNGLDIAIAGASGAENSFSVDGLKTNDMRYGGQSVSLPSEFIDQVDIQTGGYKPEFSALGGVFNVTTKSGSNQFQGSTWAYWTPSALKPAAKQNAFYKESAPTDVYEFGAWVGGPIIKDTLFYSVGVDYQRTEAPASSNLSGNTIGADKIPNTIFMGKLNYFVNTDNQLTFSYFGNDKKDTRANTAGIPGTLYDGRGDANSGRTIENSTYNYNLTWDANLSSNLNLSTKIGQSHIDYKVLPADTSSRIIDYTYYTTGAGAGTGVASGTRWVTGGGGDTDHEVNKTSQFSSDLSWILGDHALKFGYSFMQSEYQIDEDYSGGQIWYVKAAYIGQRVYENHSNAKAGFQAVYAQDVWQATKGLNVFYGFRSEQQEQKSGLDGHTFMKFRFQDYIQPRLGFTWDVAGNGLSKLSGSFAQYYEQIPQRIAVRTYGNEQYYQNYYGTVGTTTYGSYSYDPTTKAVTVSGTPYKLSFSDGWSNDPIADDLKLPKRVEFTLGYDHQVSTTTSLGMHAKYRKLTDVIEDSIMTDASGVSGSQAIIWNPHKGKVTYTDANGQKVTATNTLIPEAYNEYKSIDVSYTRKTADNLIFVGYTWSRNYGTYEGLISPSNGQDDGNITASFDYYSYVGTGLVPTDHTHSFKAYGYQKFHFRDSDVLTLGFNLQVQSGSPYSYKDNGYSTTGDDSLDVGGYGDAVFENGKMGNKGRTPTTKKLDLTVQYETHLTPKVTLEPMVQVYNVTSCRVATQVEEAGTDNNGTAFPAGKWSSATQYQEGRSVRFGARLKF